MLLRSWLADWCQKSIRLLRASRQACQRRTRRHIVHGSTEALESRQLLTTIDLANLGTDGTTIYGVDPLDRSGFAVSKAGDVNGDGFDDVIIGAFGSSGLLGSLKRYTGECYLVFGGPSMPATIDAATLGTAGVKIYAIDEGDQFGAWVSAAGDINHDGFDDVIIGAPEADGPNNTRPRAGECYVIFGAATLPATINLATLGTAGITIYGANSGDNAGTVGGGGDVNGDGFDDIIIGAANGDGPDNNREGCGDSYVIYGGPNLPTTIDLAILGSGGVTIYGKEVNDVAGQVAIAGDINGDGFDDLLIGAPSGDGVNNTIYGAGESYIIFGGDSLPETIDLAVPGSAAVTLFGIDDRDLSGFPLAAAGDVNGDGFDDIIIAAYWADGSDNSAIGEGESYIVFGGDSLPATIQLGALGAAGITIYGRQRGDYSGRSVSSAGDVNHDGYDDVVIGAYHGEAGGMVRENSGDSYVIFGGPSLPGVIDLNNLGSLGITLFGVDAGDISGSAVAGAGDVNGDGFDDLLIGAPYSGGHGDNSYRAGETYLLFGRQFAVNQPPVFTSPAAFNVAENTTTVATVVATDPDLPAQTISYTITGGVDQAKFLITINGMLRFISAPNFENPTDNGSNNVYNVQVTAQDGHGGSTTQDIVVTVTPVNDNLPVFTSSATFNVAENMTLVGTVVATDADLPSQSITYSIVGGADQAKFSITAGGVLTFIAPPDFESPTDVGTNNVYNVQVQANDGNGGQSVQNIAVTITPVNDNSPVFTSTTTFQVVEHSTNVGSVIATDADLPAQTVTYSITGGADQAQFSLTSGGVLSFVTAPSFDSPTDAGLDNVYNVQVTANDGNGRTTVQNIAVTVQDLNEFSPVFTSPANFNVAENSTTVGTVTATDADLPAQTITYSLSGGEDQANFTLTAQGALSFISPPDFEAPGDVGADNVYHVQVTADDGRGRSTVQAIAITVTPVDDNTLVFTSPETYSINENTTSIGTVVAIDADTPAQVLTYSIVGGVDQSKFSLSPGGVLSFTIAPDFENPTDNGANNVYNVAIMAADDHGGTVVQIINVTVNGVNDNSPVFTSPATVNVVELATAVVTLAATDADLPTQSISLAITGGADQARFAIVNEVLQFISPPDFENPSDVGGNNVYEVQVTADDAHGRTTVQSLSITVLPGNDNAPVFTSPAEFTVTENSTAVGVVTATDADLPAQNLTYSIAGGVDQAKFAITAGGVLSFVTGPDFENPTDNGANNVYNVVVLAADGNGEFTAQVINVTVTPVNDNSPVFTSPSTFDVIELETLVGTLQATDADLPAQSITFAVTGGADQNQFTLNNNVLRFVTAADFENPLDSNTDNVYEVQVTANDGNGRSTVQTLLITVTPRNDNSPVFTTPATFEVPENTAVVATIVATDADLPAQTISYFISGGVDQAKFEITENGVLSFVTPPDFENPGDVGADNVYNVIVTAADGNGTQTFQQLTITVTPVNDNPLVFTSAQTFNVAENSTAVGSLVAIDADLPSSPVSYSISGVDAIWFSLSPEGVLSFTQSPDFENPTDVGQNNVYNVRVSADNGQGQIAVSDITINVTPVNEAPTVTSSPNYTVPENATIVGTVIVADPDLPMQTIAFSITGGADAARFAISNAGVLTFIVAPDFEHPTDVGANNVYNVQITGNDGQGGTAVQDLTITVVPVNEDSPVFTSAATFSVAENTSAVGLVVATDADLPSQTVTFSITGGADATRFSVTSGGVLSFVTAPNFENPVDADANNIYNIQVTANDGNGKTTNQSITISVTPVNDNVPVFVTPTTLTVPENSVTVGSIVATDADLPAQNLVYSISGGADQSLFAITSGGVLTFLSAPDFELPTDADANNVYNIQVRVNDGQGLIATRNLSITVTNLDEISPTATITPVTPDPRTVATDSITIVFSEPVTGFGLDDLTLTRNGGGNLLTGSETLTSANNRTFVLSGLAGVTALEGTYALVLTANESGIVDSVGNPFVVGTSTSWTVDTTVPTVAITPVSPNPRATAVASITIVFSEAVSGFEVNDLSLTRNGGPNLLTGAESLTTFDNITYTLGNLNVTTGELGSYLISLNGATSGIHDTAGNPLSGIAGESWTRINPSVSLSVNKGTLAEASEMAIVTATLSMVTDENVTVTLSFGGSATFPGDYSHTATQIVIPAGNLTGSVTLVTVQDGELEQNEDIIVEITDVTNGVENGEQQIQTLIMDDDHAPVFTTPAAVSIPENGAFVLAVAANDADLPAQPLTYSISGGVDQALFSITVGGNLSFLSAPDFEVPTDSNGDNIYEVQVNANDGHGGVATQQLFVTITDVGETPELDVGGPSVTWIKKQPPVTVLPLVTVGSDANLTGGTLTLSVNTVRTAKKVFDQFGIPAFNAFGSSSGPQFVNGQMTLQIQLNQGATNSNIQSFLRSLTFSTNGKGLKTSTRSLEVTLTTAGGNSVSVTQTINVRKKA